MVNLFPLDTVAHVCCKVHFIWTTFDLRQETQPTFFYTGSFLPVFTWNKHRVREPLLFVIKPKIEPYWTLFAWAHFKWKFLSFHFKYYYILNLLDTQYHPNLIRLLNIHNRRCLIFSKTAWGSTRLTIYWSSHRSLNLLINHQILFVLSLSRTAENIGILFGRTAYIDAKKFEIILKNDDCLNDDGRTFPIAKK